MLTLEQLINKSVSQALITERAVLRYAKELEKVYSKCVDAMNTSILAFFGKYADSEGKINLSTAKRKLNSKEFREFKKKLEIWIYADISEAFRTKLNRYDDRLSISRLEALQLELEYDMEEYHLYQAEYLPVALEGAVLYSYYNTYYMLCRGVKGGVAFVPLDDETLGKILKAKRFDVGLWERLHSNKANFAYNLGIKLPSALSRGFSGEKSSEEVKKTAKTYNFKSISLVRTYVNSAMNDANIEAYRNSLITHYRYVAILDNRTSEICRELDGNVFKISEAEQGVNLPPMHNNCRSSVCPIIKDEDSFRRKTEKATTDALAISYIMSENKFLDKHIPREQYYKVLNFLDKK